MFANLQYPIIQAPMAGESQRPTWPLPFQDAGARFLAAGYKTPEAIEQEIIKCKDSALPFGVNLFVPQNDEMDESLHLYKERLEEDFRIRLALPEPGDDY